MRLGLVLSQTPTYSETFFISKINGLQNSGYKITLFVQKKAIDFMLCKVIEAPKVYEKNRLFQFANNFVVGFKLLKHIKRVRKFIYLEKKAYRSWKQILKNLYNNSHLLKADLDWLHFGFATMALQSEHVAKAINAKMGVSFRGYDIAIYPVKHNNCYNLLWKNIDKVHTISNDLIRIAYEMGMTKDTQFQKITPAINIHQFTRDVLKEECKNEHLYFITIARLNWKKGIIDTLEALAKIKLEGIKFTYNIVGTGVELENIKFAIHQLNLDNNVIMYGRKNPKEIVQLLVQSDIYLQYSISEGFCNSLLEAQAMGLLCIASDAEGLPENVVHKKTGWIVPKRNPESLAKRIMEVIILSDEEKLQIKNNAKERVASDFNIEKQLKEFLKFYE